MLKTKELSIYGRSFVRARQGHETKKKNIREKFDNSLFEMGQDRQQVIQAKL